MSEIPAASAADGAEASADGPSYHDLHITAAHIPRTSIFNLPYGLEVTCNRVTGWVLASEGNILAGEYEGPEGWLVLDVAGHVIIDSRHEAGEDQ